MDIVLSFSSSFIIRVLPSDFLNFVLYTVCWHVTDHHIDVAVVEAGQDMSVASVVLWLTRDQA